MWYPTQQQNSTDQVANFFWLLVLVMGAFLLLWWYARQWIVIPVFWVRVHEIQIISLVSNAWSHFAKWVHLPTPNVQNLNRLQYYMQHTSVRKISFDDFSRLNRYIGNWVRYPTAFILVSLAVVVHFFHKGSRFCSTYNMQDLRKLEGENWPQIKPIMPMDLLKEDIDQGPWAMSQLPLAFCKENQLLSVKEVQGKKQWSLQRGPAQRVFALQLGPLWRGAKNLPIHIKALFVIFFAKANKDRDLSKQLIRQIAASAETGKLDFTGVEELLKKYQDSSILQWLEKRHAYVYTVMASLLEVARTDGVLASAEFLWLKPLDRKLWYVLNCVGRQTAFTEIAGVYAHWLAEKKVGYAMKTPMVKEAVVALELCISETLFIEEGERWHINSAA
jgi:intracellular multiplication protein IcmP